MEVKQAGRQDLASSYGPRRVGRMGSLAQSQIATSPISTIRNTSESAVAFWKTGGGPFANGVDALRGPLN